jgi:hypothetical protein
MHFERLGLWWYIDEGGPPAPAEDEDEEEETLPEWLEEVNKVAARPDDVDEEEAKEAEEQEEAANLTPAQQRMRTLITGNPSAIPLSLDIVGIT